MKHLSCEQILSLSEKLLYNMSFSTDDELAMLHIAYCEECYKLLCSTMALDLIWNGHMISCW